MSVPSQSKTRRSNRRGIGRGERIEKSRELGCKCCVVGHALTGQWMGDGEAMGVQEHPFEAFTDKSLVQVEIAVLVVAGDRKPKVREVHPDLVRAAGLELRFDQAESRNTALQPDD